MDLGDFHKDFTGSAFDKYYQPLCLYAEYLKVGSHDAEDIVVGVFQKLLQQPDIFKKVENIKAYLYTATKNACFDHLAARKKEKKHNHLLAYLNESAIEETDRPLIKAEVLELVYNAIDQLPPQFKAVMQELAAGKKTDQIAREMGISVQTVRNYKTEAVKLLRIALLEHGLLVLLLIEYLFGD